MKYFLVVLFLTLQASSVFAKTMTHIELLNKISSKLNRTVFVDIVEPLVISDADSAKIEKGIDSGIGNADALKALVEPLGYGVLELKDTHIVLFNLLTGESVPGINLDEAKYRILVSKAIASKLAIPGHDVIDPTRIEIFNDLKSGRIKMGEPIPLRGFLEHYPVFRDSLFNTLVSDISKSVNRVSGAVHRVKDNPASIFWKKIGEAQLLVAHGRFGNTFLGGQSDYVILSGNSVMTQVSMNDIIGTDKKRWGVGGLDFSSDFPVEAFIASIKDNKEPPPPTNLQASPGSTIEELLGMLKLSVSSHESWVPKKKIVSFGKQANKEILLDVIQSLYSLEHKFDGDEKVLLTPRKFNGGKDLEGNIKSLVGSVSPELWRAVYYRAVMLSKRDLAKGRSWRGILEGDIFPEYLNIDVVVSIFRKLAFDVRNELDEHKPSANKYSLEKSSDRIKDDFGLMFYDCLVTVVVDLYFKKLAGRVDMYENLDKFAIKFQTHSVSSRSLAFILTNTEGQDVMVSRLASSSFK